MLQTHIGHRRLIQIEFAKLEHPTMASHQCPIGTDKCDQAIIISSSQALAVAIIA